MATENRQVFIASPINGQIMTDNIGVRVVPYPTANDGEVLLKTSSMSADPYLRILYGSSPAGTVVVNSVIGTVLESKSDAFAVGDIVTGMCPLQTFTVSPADKLQRVENPLGLPLSSFIGALGFTGQTALGALQDTSFKAGEVVFVTGAAGAVGSLLGQLARHLGAKKVIGSAGGPEKCKLVVEKFGFDACIDYKEHTTAEAFGVALSAALGDDAVDYFADNTGGHVTAALWDLLANKARVAVIGAISEYNDGEPPLVRSFLAKLIFRSITVRGFVLLDWLARAGTRSEFFALVPQLVKDGVVAADETVYTGIDSFPEAFVGLFTGANTGKMIVNL
jgi:NADPH-dependent curcumin reductase CurA